MTKIILIFLIGFGSVFGLKRELCRSNDDDCLTDAIKQHVYPLFVTGLPGVERSDPIGLDELTIDLPDSVYKLRKPVVTGFRLCDFQKLKLERTPQNQTFFVYELLCPHLTLNSDYELKNKTGADKESGKCEIGYSSYYITITGQFIIINDELLQPHLLLNKYFKPILDLQKGATCKYESTDNNIKSEEYYNNIEKRSRQIVMAKILDKFVYNLKNFVFVVPVEDLYFKYV